MDLVESQITRRVLDRIVGYVWVLFMEAST